MKGKTENRHARGGDRGRQTSTDHAHRRASKSVAPSNRTDTTCEGFKTERQSNSRSSSLCASSSNCDQSATYSNHGENKDLCSHGNETNHPFIASDDSSSEEYGRHDSKVKSPDKKVSFAKVPDSNSINTESTADYENCDCSDVKRSCLDGPLTHPNHSGRPPVKKARYTFANDISASNTNHEQLHLAQERTQVEGPNEEIGVTRDSTQGSDSLTTTGQDDEEVDDGNQLAGTEGPMHHDATISLSHGDSPRRGTYEQMQNFFEQQLRAVLREMSGPTMGFTMDPDSEVQPGSNVTSVLMEILGRQRTSSNLVDSMLRERPPAENPDSDNTTPQMSSNPMYSNAVRAWTCLSRAQFLSSNASNASESLTESDGNSQLPPLFDFPSEAEVNALCWLLVQAITAGAVIGFAAMASRCDEEVLTERTDSPDNSDTS